MRWRLFLTDHKAKPLLRAACGTGRVAGRGHYEEKGDIVFSAGKDLSDDPTVMRMGGHYFVREAYPAEVDLTSLQSWVASMERDSSLLASSWTALGTAEETEDKQMTASFEAIAYAISEMGDDLAGLSVARRTENIRKFLRDRKKLVPSEKTIQRFYSAKIGQG